MYVCTRGLRVGTSQSLTGPQPGVKGNIEPYFLAILESTGRSKFIDDRCGLLWEAQTFQISLWRLSDS